MVPYHFTAFPKEKYQQTSGIDLRLKKAIDRDLVLKLEEQGEVAHIEDYLYYYRINDNSISNNQHAYKAEYWAWECRYAACERRGRAKDEIYDTVLRYRNAGNEQYFDAKTTIDYKLGNMILAPLRWLKYKLKFNRMKN